MHFQLAFRETCRKRCFYGNGFRLRPTYSPSHMFLQHTPHQLVGIAVFLFAIYSNNRLQSLFDNRFSHFLGELSFPVYLVHLPIVVSLESYLILRLCADGIVTRGSAYFIILVTLAASLFAGLAFVYVERFAIKASNSFFAFIDGL
jgi:peptidoglycan/LPS O-acetylase OafA/YrhL